MKINGLLIDNLKISIDSIKSNSLRTILTVLIIAIGIMALIGILTAVESIKSTITSEFVNMGANTFTINRLRSNQRGERNINNVNIKYEEAIRFKNNFIFPAKISIMLPGTNYATLKYEDNKTNPTITVNGIDEEYLNTSGRNIKYGRNFTSNEVLSGENIIIIGSELVSTLFSTIKNPVDEYLLVGNIRYRVVGVLEEKGSSFGGNRDKLCLIPLNNARQYFSNSWSNYVVSVMPDKTEMLDLAISEAEGVFRNVRKLTVYDANNFEIVKSDNLSSMLLENITMITLGATIIGLITLFGASIGLMNIMLVSVSERTREVGIRKALGAKSQTIKQQFLFESVFIGQLGGLLGIILGVIAGNLISLFTKSAFIVPWFWIFIGVFLCFLVGIASGYLPAVKASKLEPIEALHYE